MLKAGTATQIINNELGTVIQGATHMKNVQRIRDDLEANALWIESDGNGSLFITCDLGGADLEYTEGLLPDIAEASGVPRDSILIGCSHTHSAPSVLGPTHPDKPIDDVYLERLRTWLCTAASEAVSSAEVAEIAWAKGHAEIGYNRRVCLADGTHVMHGDPNRPDATGLEGRIDPQHTAFFVRAPGGPVKAVLYNSTAHPINFYGADFLSADFPGLARQYLRDVFGTIPVLFFNGAIGDISIVDEFWKSRSPESAEQRVARAAHIVTGETLRLLQHADFTAEAAVAHAVTRFDADLRPLPEERLQWARGVMKNYRNGNSDESNNLLIATAHLTILFHERFGDKTTETINLHAGRLGELAFVTVPCEIFCHFGLELKRRSPFPITAVFGITNGDMGYCPTIEGTMGGSWEGTGSLISRWDVQTGYRIVDEWSRMLHGLI
jgi:hypothetical protein